MPDSRVETSLPAVRSVDELARLVALGPEAQGDVDESLLRDNLRLTPLERLVQASRAATQVELLRDAVQRANHG